MENKDYEKQNEQLNEMNYDASEDIFVHEKHISLDENGIPIYDDNLNEYDMEMNMDVPGADSDDSLEEIGSEDEENNYWS